MRWRLKSPASRLFTQSLIQAQIKENIKAPRHWSLCGEFTGYRWIPRTKGQLRGKCFHLMTLSCQGLTHMSNWRDQARHVSTFIWFNLHHRGRLSSLVYLLLIAICDISQANDVNKLPRNLGNTYKMECSIEMTFYEILWCSSIMKQSGWLRSVSTLICAAEIPFDITDCGVHIHWTKIYIDWKINQQQTTNCFDPCCAEFILRNI